MERSEEWKRAIAVGVLLAGAIPGSIFISNQLKAAPEAFLVTRVVTAAPAIEWPYLAGYVKPSPFTVPEPGSVRRSRWVTDH